MGSHSQCLSVTVQLRSEASQNSLDQYLYHLSAAAPLPTVPTAPAAPAALAAPVAPAAGTGQDIDETQPDRESDQGNTQEPMHAFLSVIHLQVLTLI